MAGEIQLTDSEERGRILFETEYNPFFPDQSGADCVHCHGGANFENDQYMNNGLDTDANMTDIGREEVTQDPNDKGKFKVPSLRNVEVTAPYMHDGRFQTLEEVIDHYSEGVAQHSNLHFRLSTVDDGPPGGTPKVLDLDEQEKAALVAFLKTLTDHEITTDEKYSDPFF